MAKPSKPRNLSKKFLMGVAVSVIPLAGCEPLASNDEARPQATEQSELVAGSEQEAALFERARSQGTVAAAEQFLQEYPNSQLVRSLLTRLPSGTLRRIDRDLVRKLSPSLVRTLPFNVKQALGVTTRQADVDDGAAAPDDGYSG